MNPAVRMAPIKIPAMASVRPWRGTKRNYGGAVAYTTVSLPLRWPPALCPRRSICLARRVRDSGGDVRAPVAGVCRSEERRVGEEGRSRWAPGPLKKKKKNKKKNLHVTRRHARTAAHGRHAAER